MNKEEFKKELKNISDSKILKIIIYAFGILVIVGFIFQAGIFVGFHKATFGRDWENHYDDNFGMMRGGSGIFGGMGMYNNLPNAHGAIGKIIKAELPTIIVLDKNNTEKVVLTSDDTTIRTMAGDGATDDLKVDDFVVVIGSPNEQGQIDAKLIRVIPDPSPTVSGTNTQ